ncbi:MAG: complex I NDUFA9 subunit family protein [Proteobacteria bacterium]|nr:complex I NDUFA9 subunit family protein [Pseudomonadota bacterium]
MKAKKNKKILIFGGSGFLGKAIIKKLVNLDFKIVLFTRKKDLHEKFLKFNLSEKLDVINWSLNNTKAIQDNFSNTEAIINFCGILYENRKGDFYKIHSDLPAFLGEMASKYDVPKLIHVSALGVSELSASLYSSSKASGEKRLLENFPKGQIVRPSLLFGEGDNFFGQFSQMASVSPVLPLISGSTKFQPVYVDDVAMAITNLLKEKIKTNTFYELGGKLVYTFEELLKMLLEVKGIKRVLLPLSPQLMKIPAFFLQILPKPPFTVDQMKLLANDNILVNGLPGLEDLGIEPRDLKSELIRIYKNK